jgi:hypothetical protein
MAQGANPTGKVRNEREAKLAAALRANLRRRKAGSTDTSDHEPPAPAKKA